MRREKAHHRSPTAYRWDIAAPKKQNAALKRTVKALSKRPAVAEVQHVPESVASS